MLEVKELHAYYGKSHILQGVDLKIAAGEVVSLLGRNGVGRSTTVKAIMGEVAPQGTIRFKGRDIAGLPSYKIAHCGLGYVPEHRDIFPGLNTPTIYVAQPYGGMDPAQMEGYLTYYYEYHFLYITGIEHVESKSVQGNALIKLQFYPGTDMAQAMAETVSYVNRARAFMPPGTVPWACTSTSGLRPTSGWR